MNIPSPENCFAAVRALVTRDDIDNGRQINRLNHITGTFDSVVLCTLCFITPPRLPRRARRHDSLNSRLSSRLLSRSPPRSPRARRQLALNCRCTAVAVLEGTRSCRLVCRCGESALLCLIVLHYPPKLTWVPSGPLVLCDLFNAGASQQASSSQPVQRKTASAS